MEQNLIDLIKKTVAKEASTEELETLIHLSKEYNLDPLKKELWFLKYGGKTTIITSRDGYLKIANSNPLFDGLEGDAVYIDDILTKRDDGSIEISYGPSHLAFDKKKLTGAFCNVWRKDRQKAASVLVSLNDYFKKSQIWEQYTSAMILKVAEAMALKRAFSISGLVTEEELEKETKTEIKEDTPEPKSKKQMVKEVFKEEEVIELISQDQCEMINEFLSKFPPNILKTKLENLCRYYNISTINQLPKSLFKDCWSKLELSYRAEERIKEKAAEKANG